MKEKPHRLYVKTGGAPFYLPISVADTQYQLAKKLGICPSLVSTGLKRQSPLYYCVELTDEEWEEIKEIDDKYGI